MNDPRRLSAQERRALIIEAAHDIAIESDMGLLDVTIESVADQCAVPTSHATIRRYFLTLRDLRHAVVIRNSEFTEQARKIGVL